MTKEQEQAIIDAAEKAFVKGTYADAIVAAIKTYDEPVASNKPTDSLNNIANVLKRQVQILADWNIEHNKTYADIEQVRKNAETITTIVPIIRLFDNEKTNHKRLVDDISISDNGILNVHFTDGSVETNIITVPTEKDIGNISLTD